MNSRRPILLLALTAVVLTLGLGAWLATRTSAPPPPLAGSGIGGPFTLVDQDGRTFTDQDLRGKYALVYFGYTFCPDVCPLDVQKMTAAVHSFGGSKTVQPVFVTVDPERDTPAVLKQFLSAFPSRVIGLTGSTAAIDQAKRSYRIYAQRAGPAGATDYLVDHMAVIYLIGPEGEPISFFGHDATAAEIVEGLRRYVR